MNLTLEILKRIEEKPFSFIPERLSLNLPTYNGNFPFHPQQKQAVELCLSNSPLVTIAGISGSGKSSIVPIITNIALQNHKSVLIVSNSSFKPYQNLSLMPLYINRENQTEYRQLFKTWLRENLSNPNLNFMSNYLQFDRLFEKVTKNSEKWLNLLDKNETKLLAEAVNREFPQESKTRQLLLVKKIQQSRQLLIRKESLKQTYQYLSDTALEELTTMAINSLKIPVICQEKYLQFLENQTFDLVIADDSHNLEKETIKTLTNYSHKLIFLGDLFPRKNNSFNLLFNSLSPAYRLEIKQNYRLNPQLGLKVLPFLYPNKSYQQFNQWNLNTFRGEKSPLIWHDIVNNDQLLPILQDNLLNFNHNYQILTFSENTRNILKQQLTNLGIYTSIKLTQECHGKDTSAQSF